MEEGVAGARVGPWDSPDIFPERPKDMGNYGYMSPNGKMQSCTREQLKEIFGPNCILTNATLVWSPDTPRLVPPGEISFLKHIISKRTEQNVGFAFLTAFNLIFLWGLMLLVQDEGTALYVVLLVLTGILPLIYAIRSWRLTKARKVNPVASEEIESSARRVGRYQAWIRLRPWSFTKWLVLVIASIGVVQITTGPEGAINRAGLQKPVAIEGELWRLLTGPVLHGGPFHLVFNLLAILGLGRAVETLAGRAYASMVFLLAVLAGSLCSVFFLPSVTSVGVSGGILGLAGFLLVLGFKSGEAIPVPLFRLLLKNLLLIGCAGLVASAYIDNAAHAGGAVSGSLLGVFLIPRNHAIPLPVVHWMRLAALLSELALVAAATLALILLLVS